MSQELAELQDTSFALGNAAVQSSLTAERRMTGAGLAAFLDAHRYAVVATTRPSGKPHAAMTSYLRAGTIFWLPTMTGTARWRNVATQPWLSLVVTEGEGDQHAAVTVDGPAETVALDAAPAELLGQLPDASWVTCWLRLTPARLFSYAAPGATRWQHPSHLTATSKNRNRSAMSGSWITKPIGAHRDPQDGSCAH